MSQNLEIPDPIFDALQQAASASGTTHVGWIAAHLPSAGKRPAPDGAKSLADLLEGHIGTVHSGGNEALSQNCGERFTDYVVCVVATGANDHHFAVPDGGHALSISC